jgi:hypothetical protein
MTKVQKGHENGGPPVTAVNFPVHLRDPSRVMSASPSNPAVTKLEEKAR